MEQKDCDLEINSVFFKTVACNQETPFEEDPAFHLPKYFASFEIGREVVFNELENNCKYPEDLKGKNCLCHQMSYKHDDDTKCNSPYGGLLFHNCEKFHDGVPVSAFTDVFEQFQPGSGPYFFHVEWIDNENERSKAIKVFNKKAGKLAREKGGKAMAFTCYKFEATKNDKMVDQTFCRFHVGGHCSKVDLDHVTVFPVNDSLEGECVEVGTNRYFLYVKDILRQGWSPCCIRVCCSGEPKAMKDSYDRDCWFAAKVIYHYLDSAIDYSEAFSLINLLQVLELNNYVRSAVEMMCKNALIDIYRYVGNIMENVLDYYEATTLMIFRETVVKEAIRMKKVTNI